jgi:hypothetical protein
VVNVYDQGVHPAGAVPPDIYLESAKFTELVISEGARPFRRQRHPDIRPEAWTNVVVRFSPEILLEFYRICPVNIPIFFEITVAGQVIGTGVFDRIPSEILFEDKAVGAVNVLVPVEIALTLTGVAVFVAGRRVGVFLCPAAEAVRATVTVVHAGSADCSFGAGAAARAIRVSGAIIHAVGNAVPVGIALCASVRRVGQGGIKPEALNPEIAAGGKDGLVGSNGYPDTPFPVVVNVA